MGMWHLQERREIHTGFWLGNMKARHHFEEDNVNTLRTGDANLRFFITNVQDG